MGEIKVGACPDCDATSRARLYDDGKYAFWECAECRGIYADPRTVLPFDDAYSEAYYRTSYLPRERESVAYYRKVVLPLIRPRTRPGGSILDIGCGTGFFLKAARDEGFRVTGLEPSRFASDYCRTHFGMDCRTQFFEDASIGAFDLISLLNVFSQLTSDRKRLLEKVRESLNPGGHFLIKTVCWGRNYPLAVHRLPNIELKRLCLHLPLQHYIYNEANIVACLKRGGFKVLEIRKCPGEWSILKGMDASRLKLSAGILIKWMMLKALCGPVRTDMLVVAAKA